MHLHQGKLGKTGGPQYWLQDIPRHVSGHLERVKACPVLLQTPYGPVKTEFVALDPNHKIVEGRAVAANAQHYRIQKGQSKISIGEAIRQWFALRTDAEFEQIEIDISFDKESRFILVPLRVKWRNIDRPQSLSATIGPLSFNSRHQSDFWKSQIERCRRTASDRLEWVGAQFKQFVHQRSQPRAKGADERDLLRLAGAFDCLGLKIGPYLKRGYDCPESVFTFLDLPPYPCPLEIKTRSYGFGYQVKSYDDLPRVVVLCLHHDLSHSPQHVDVIEAASLARYLSS